MFSALCNNNIVDIAIFTMLTRYRVNMVNILEPLYTVYIVDILRSDVYNKITIMILHRLHRDIINV